MRALYFFALGASLSLASSTAFATHPDHEGERGFELTLQPGLGVFGASDDGVFCPPYPQPGAGRINGCDAPVSAFSSTGFSLRASLGYRVIPLLSAGLSVGFQSLSPSGEYSPSLLRYSPSDSLSNFAFGLYARFYFLSLINGTRQNPRVFFRGALDPRRFEAYFTLGLDLVQGIRRQRTYSDPLVIDTWRTSYLGIMVGAGAEYRLTTALALGIGLSVSPLVGAVTDNTAQTHTVTPSTDTVAVASATYTPASGNTQVFLGFSVRYTLTLF